MKIHFSLVLQNISQVIAMTEEIATKSCAIHERNMGLGYSQHRGMMLEVTTFASLGLCPGLYPYYHILPSVAARHFIKVMG